MKKLLILSGKGGTGKTTVASAFIHLSKTKAYADCDVDAPNLHLLKQNHTGEKHFDYFGMDKAKIHSELCIGCGRCQQNCRFDAITSEPIYAIDPFACEGCGVCAWVCPEKAIVMQRVKAGDLSVFEGEAVFSTATLKMGSGTTGLLVSEVKKNLKTYAKEGPIAILDGSPGIGCPVIASISGVDMVLMVTEPSVSGLSDLKRIVRTARIFNPKMAVCINKFDTNCTQSEAIIAYCNAEGIAWVGNIPYDVEAVKAINAGITVDQLKSPVSAAIEEVFIKTFELFDEVVGDEMYKII